jgi:hypothetical protein
MQPDMRPFDEQMRQELVRVSFDFDRPAPAIGWRAFKAFSLQPVAGQKTVALGFSCYHASDRDQTLWFHFARQLEDESTGVEQNCGCAFSRPVPPDLAGFVSLLWPRQRAA